MHRKVGFIQAPKYRSYRLLTSMVAFSEVASYSLQKFIFEKIEFT